MLNVVKEGSQVKVDDFGLRLHNPLSYAVDRFMGRSLRSISVRSRLKVSFENRLLMSLRAPWTTRSRIEGMERTRTFVPPSFGISFFRTAMGRYVLVFSSFLIC